MQRQVLIRRAERQVSCPLRDEAAVLNLASGTYYGLDSVGARIWDLIERPKTLGELHDALVSEYDVSPDACRQDIERFVADLARAGLVEIQEPPHETPPTAGV
jgi:hypothetical protein